jgi:ABC-2 type transport system permease protein
MIETLDRAVPGARFAHVVRMEWTRFASLVSYRWLMASALVLAVGVGLLFTLLAIVPSSTPDLAGVDPLSMTFASQGMARLALVVVGALMITSEFGTGQALSTFTVVPQRWRVLAAKSVVLTAAATVVGVVTGLTLLISARLLLSANDIPVTTSVADQTSLVLGTAVQFVVVGLFALGLGAWVRSTAGALVGGLATFTVLSSLGFAYDAVRPYLPGNAAASILAIDVLPGTPGPVLSAIVAFGWAGLMLGVGALALETRDL